MATTYKGYTPPRPFGGNLNTTRAAATKPKAITKPGSTTLTRDPMEYEKFLRANGTPDSQIQGLVDAALSPQQQQVRTSESTRQPDDRLRDLAGGELLRRSALDQVKDFGSAATGGGGGGRTQPGTGDKYDGFAGRYVPGERDLLFSNPGIIVQDWLESGPYKNNPQLAGDLMRYADIVFGNGNQPGLYELMLGGNLGKNGANVGDDKQINYLADLLNQQSQVGGRSPSVQGMVKMLYEMMDNPNSGLNVDLGAGGTDPAGTQETISKLLAFIPLLGEFTGNQRFSRLLGQDAQNIAQQYMRQQANGNADGSFQDYFRQNFLR